MKTLVASIVLSLSVVMTATGAQAVDVLRVRSIGMDLARDLANGAVMACREKGFQVSAVVVDRGGAVMAALRDDLAARFTLEIAERKANTSVLSGVASGELRASRADIRPELNQIDGIIIMEGGLPVVAGGHRVGAIGVSGAPGGDLDAECAQAAIDDLFDRLEFAK